MNTFADKVVLVTGAGKGAGRQVAELFASQGAVVAAADLTPINLDETVARIVAAEGKVKSFLVDIAKKMPVQGLLNQVLDEFHSLDILINCAEVEPHKFILEMEEWDWVRTMDVNLTGAFLLTQSAGRIMKNQGGGTIIHVSEKAPVTEGCTAYLVSKSALEKMVTCAADEFSKWGIKVYLAGSADQVLKLCTS